MLLVLKMEEETTSQWMSVAASKPEEAGTGFPLGSPKKGYSPANTFLDSWHPELENNKICDIWSLCTWSNLLQQQ